MDIIIVNLNTIIINMDIFIINITMMIIVCSLVTQLNLHQRLLSKMVPKKTDLVFFCDNKQAYVQTHPY